MDLHELWNLSLYWYSHKARINSVGCLNIRATKLRMPKTLEINLPLCGLTVRHLPFTFVIKQIKMSWINYKIAHCDTPTSFSRISKESGGRGKLDPPMIFVEILSWYFHCHPYHSETVDNKYKIVVIMLCIVTDSLIGSWLLGC